MEEEKKKEDEGGGDDGGIQQRVEGLSLTSPATEEGEGERVAKVGGAGNKSRAQKRKVHDCTL